MRKCILSLYIVLAIVLTGVISPFSANGMGSTVSASNASEAAALISALTDINEKTAEKEQITRSEFVITLMSLVSTDGILPSPSQVFSDVPITHQAAAAITALYNMGYAEGYGGQFMPDDAITYNQAYKLLVSVTGYGVLAAYNGGYPTGYVVQAAKAGISKNIVSNSEFITGENYLIMLLNAVTIDMMQISSVGVENTHQVVKNENILSLYHKIYTVRGIVTATTKTVLDQAAKETKKDKIEIDKKEYNVNGSICDEYLGYSIKAYYKNDEDINTVICVVPYNNIVAVVKSDDILRFDASASSLYYEVNKEKEASYRLNRTFDFVYNGRPYFGYDENTFLIEEGEIILIDNNSDGRYDVALVNEIKYIYVSSVTADKRVFDKNGEISLDLSDELVKTQIFIRKAGVESLADFSDIKDGNLLCVNPSMDGKHVKIVITSDSLSGDVSELYEDEIVIGGNTYKLSKYFQKYYKSLNTAGQLVGASCNFMVSDGKVVVLLSEDGFMKYGIAIDITGTKKLDEDTRIKFLTSSGEIKIMNIAPKLRLDDVEITNDYSVGSFLYNVFSRKYTPAGQPEIRAFYHQLIRYKVINDKITVIDTQNNAYRDAAGNDPEIEYGFLPDNIFDTNNTNMLRAQTERFQSKRFVNSRQFGDVFRASESAVVFLVPSTIENTDKEYKYEDTDFEVIPLANLRNTYSIPFKGYNVSQAGIADVVVCHNTATTADAYSAVAVIDKVVTTINSKQEETRKIYYWNSDGRFYTSILSEEMFIKFQTEPISAGDVIFYNQKGDEIKAYGHYLKYPSVFPGNQYTPAGFNPTNGDGSEITGIMGVVDAKDGSTINIVDKSGINRIVGVDRGRVVIFDCMSKQLTHGTAADIIAAKSSNGGSASIVFIRRNSYYNANVTVIYKTERR